LEVISAHEFYLEEENAKRPDVPQKPQAATSFEIDGIYNAKFTDDVYYRARIVKESGKEKYYVHFIDYGNYDHVSKANIGTLSEDLKKVKSPLYKCSLFGVDGLTNEALHILKDFIGANLKG
jgi:hypothetical protein